jgi:hypothetical protein
MPDYFVSFNSQYCPPPFIPFFAIIILMITLEIIQSPDPSEIGTYPYLFDAVYIGKSQKADIQIEDQSFPLKYLTIKCNLEFLSVHNELDTPFYFVNGKKMSGVRKLKINDIISFASYQIKVLEFKRTFVEEDLSPFFDRFKKEAPELQFLLTFLENKIVELEGIEGIDEEDSKGKDHV